MKKLLALTVAAVFSFAPIAGADIDNLDIGGDVLFLYTYTDNTADLNDNANDQTDFFRTEAHLYFQADLDDNITARISVEADRALDQGTVVGRNTLGGANEDLEIFLEEAFVSWQNAMGSNFNLSAGRQFLNYGDNSHADNYNGWWGNSFVFGDARSLSPANISALGTYEIDPFDAIVAQYEAEMWTADIVYYIDSEELNSGAAGNDGDAEGILVYGSYYGFEGHQVDLYYNYNEQTDLAGGSLGFEGDQHTFGTRAAGDIMPTVAYKVEFAYQFQDNDAVGGVENEGFAVQGGLNYHPDMNYNPNIGILYSYFEEDNNGAGGFSAPFEAKDYGLLAEGFIQTRVGPLTNMHVINAYGGLEFTDNIAGTLDLYYFILDEDVANPAGGTDDDGGFEVDGQVDYLINDNMTAFLGGGVFFPGDAAEAIAANNDDEAYFVRTGFKVNF